MRTVSPGERGFALVLTLAVLAILVLALYALSALTQVGAQLTATGSYQVQARQHALLGLGVALGELQRHAGADEVHTGMAGVIGIPAGAGHPARQWCGVWDGAGVIQHWLVSGVEGQSIPVLAEAEGVKIVAEGALGADGADKEHVQVPWVSVDVVDLHGVMRREGRYAWWVGDEGIKLSAVLADTETPLPGAKHAIDELIPALSPTASNLSRVEAFGQLALVPSPSLTPGQLQANFHVLARTHVGPAWSGLLNVNTTAARFWRGVAATYNRLKPADASTLEPVGFGNAMRDAGLGMQGGVAEFLASAPLAEALSANGDARPEDFAAVMQPWLTTRSDTFRIRSYGDANNPVDPTRIEATAWCEAIVERTPAPLPGFGRRFVIRYFRWLGTDDL